MISSRSTAVRGARACGLGINPAVAYLVLARGTGADNRTSTWSVQAVENYTSISRGRAQDALKTLQRVGLTQALRDGTRPKYHLTPAHEIPGCEGYPPPPLDDVEERLMDVLLQGQRPWHAKATKEWNYRSPNAIAKELVEKGWLRDVGQQSLRERLRPDGASSARLDLAAERTGHRGRR